MREIITTVETKLKEQRSATATALASVTPKVNKFSFNTAPTMSYAAAVDKRTVVVVGHLEKKCLKRKHSLKRSSATGSGTASGTSLARVVEQAVSVRA